MVKGDLWRSKYFYNQQRRIEAASMALDGWKPPLGFPWSLRPLVAAQYQYGCSVGEGQEIRLSQEHSACQWVTAHEAAGLFPAGHWLRELMGRSEVMRRLLPEELRQFHRTNGVEI